MKRLKGWIKGSGVAILSVALIASMVMVIPIRADAAAAKAYAWPHCTGQAFLVMHTGGLGALKRYMAQQGYGSYKHHSDGFVCHNLPSVPHL